MSGEKNSLNNLKIPIDIFESVCYYNQVVTKDD